jgi:hypothetical protein
MESGNSEMMLTLEPRDEYLLATVVGQASLTEAIEGYKKAFDDAVSRGLDKILVDCSGVKGGLSGLEQYELGRTMAEYSLGSGIKVAKVSTSTGTTEFVSLVAFNRGLTVETFSDRHAAVEWLKRFSAKAAAS